ncbi:MAG: NYN domain-containing protein [Spirochaetes bacterium]|nr:NYN domain-containing protein [Spirochaetota bacterium]MCK5266637.1 NYN domain-containing protein [Spirochaetota bacterium]
MIVKNKDQRVAVLVDVQNLYYSAKNHFSSRINFRNLLSIALENRTLIRAIAYVIKADERETEFFDAVNNAGFEIKEKGIQIFPDGSKKGDWDVGITMDAVRLGEKVDSIVLVSGDGDYIPVVTYLQQRFGCLVEVIAFSKTCSNKLQETADDFIAIEDHKGSLLFRIKRNIKSGSNRKTPPKKYNTKTNPSASVSKPSDSKTRSTSPITKLKKLFKKE